MELAIKVAYIKNITKKQSVHDNYTQMTKSNIFSWHAQIIILQIKDSFIGNIYKLIF